MRTWENPFSNICGQYRTLTSFIIKARFNTVFIHSYEPSKFFKIHAFFCHWWLKEFYLNQNNSSPITFWQNWILWAPITAKWTYKPSIELCFVSSKMIPCTRDAIKSVLKQFDSQSGTFRWHNNQEITGHNTGYLSPVNLSRCLWLSWSLIDT